MDDDDDEERGEQEEVLVDPYSKLPVRLNFQWSLCELDLAENGIEHCERLLRCIHP